MTNGVFRGSIGSWPLWKKIHHRKKIGELGLPFCVSTSGQQISPRFEILNTPLRMTSTTALAPTICLGSHQNIWLHTGARANVVLLTYLLNITHAPI